MTVVEASTPKRSPEAILQMCEWTVLKRLDGLLQGDYRTLFRGFGIDLADLREYQTHDDVRHIDWNVTARMQTPYVRQFTEDREVTAWFLIDRTASMNFGSGEQRKHEVLFDHVALLARLLTKHGNRIGAIIYRGHSPSINEEAAMLQVIPPATGRAQVLLILNQLLKVSDEQVETKTNTSTPKIQSNLGEFLKQCGAILKRRSLVFFSSDLQSTDDYEPALVQLTKRHELIVLQSQDALERELPNLGVIQMQDAETGEQLWVDTGNKQFRETFAKLQRERAEQKNRLFARWQIEQLPMGTVEELIGFSRARAALRKTKVNGQLMEAKII
jgi:uncharacterized protein (DUF58 family)